MKLKISRNSWTKCANKDLKSLLKDFDVYGITKNGTTSIVLIDDPLLNEIQLKVLGELNCKLGFDKKSNKFILFIRN